MFTNVTLLYFLLLIPLSGFIAWLGDRIGHKSGKRRHTLFGLRPRHTAMVFTVGTGMCISLVSFALMYGLSSEFRSVISDGFRLYSTNRELKHSNEALTQGNSRLTRVANQRKQDADRADQKRSEAISAKTKADADAKNAVAAELRAVTEQKKAESELTQAQNRLATETQSLQSVKGSLQNVQASLRNVQGTLKERSARLADANLRVAQAKRRVEEATTSVQLARGVADRAQKEAQSVLRTATEAIARQKQTLNEQKQSLADLQLQYDNQSKLFDDQKKATDGQRLELARLNTQVADSETTLRRIRNDTEALRAKGITYQVNEEVARVAIKPGYNVWRLEGILGSFIADAARKAELRGARKGNGGSALIVPPPNGIVEANSDGAGGKGKKATLEEQKQMDATITGAAELIRTKNTDVLVVVSSVANAVAGEPVTVMLKLSPNPIVFHADTQISDARIDGNASPVAIDEAFRAFLNTDLRSKLLRAGVIGKSSGGIDSDATLSLGGVTPDDWLHIMDRIRLAGDNAHIVVTASQDMRAGDIPVPLHFDVKGVPNSAYRNASTW